MLSLNRRPGKCHPHVQCARRFLELGFRLMKTGEVYDPNDGAEAKEAA
jgi:hypothetical protein